MDRLHLEIITPDRVMVSEDVDTVEACGAMGEFGILPGHINYLASIVPGEIRYATGSATRTIAASVGFAEVVDNKVTFLVETAEFAEEIDVARATRARERAEGALKDLSFDQADYRLQELALLRAIARISAASKIKSL